MKKKIKNLLLINSKVKKFLLMMKLLAILLTFGLTNISATVYSQLTKFNFQAENQKVVNVLREIESSSDFRFFYIREHVDVERRVSVIARDSRVEEILEKIFDDHGVSYEIKENNLIILRPENNSLTRSPSQNITVKGQITDNRGQPLPGVNIVEEGTSNGTISDIKGQYTITVSSEDAVLVYSFVGYNTEKREIDGKREINITLTEDVESLEEVVVIGYGQVKKSDLTGAVSSIKAEEISKAAVPSITQMMQGRASGVMINQVSSQPGGGFEILIRGQASTNADNQPLYIIDGMPVNNSNIEPTSGVGGKFKYTAGSRNPLNTINPNDVESIEILKDASATAIYGARAANGVVLITTKEGSEELKVNYEARYSMQQIKRYQEVLNAEQFMKYYDIQREQYFKYSLGVYPYGAKPEESFTYEPRFTEEDVANAGEGTDWFEKITRTGIIHDHNLSISGGNENTRVFTSLNYYDHTGVLINNDMTRFSGRLNLDQKISERIKFGLNLTGSQIDNNNASLGTGYWNQMPVIGAALAFPPIYPVYDSLGNYTENELYGLSPNPVSYSEIEDQTLEERWMGKLFTEISLAEGLTLRPSAGFDNFSSDRTQYLPNTFKYGAADGGRATKALNEASNYLFETTLNFARVFADNHNVSSVLGYSYEKYNNEGFDAFATNFFTDKFGANNLEAGSSEPEVSSFKDQRVLASYFGRLQYSFNSKYLLTVTGRLDGSDRFGANNKWAFFPSAAIGWNLAKENFMQSFRNINSLKLRVSAGQTGNASIGESAFAYYGPVGPIDFSYQFDDVIYSGMGKIQQENPDLKWETTTEYNLGLDLGLWNNRVQLSGELFRKKVTDLLFGQPMQIYHQVSYAIINAGATQSSGYEFSLEANILSSPTLNWSVYMNGSKYVDKWVERAPEAISNLSPWLKINDYLRPAYGYIPDHIFQIGEEQPHQLMGGLSYHPGSLVVKDIDGWQTNETGDYVLDQYGRRIKTGEPDGIVNEADKGFLGTRDPDFIFGFGTNLKYKGFDLSIAFNGMLNYWLANLNYRFHVLRSEDIYGGINRGVEFMDTWTPQNPDGEVPLTIKGDGFESLHDYAMKWQEVSFLKINSVTLGYTIPKKILGTSIRVYLDGNNLFTFSNLENMDPETIRWRDRTQYEYLEGTGLFAYPSSRTYTFGLSVNF